MAKPIVDDVLMAVQQDDGRTPVRLSRGSPSRALPRVALDLATTVERIQSNFVIADPTLPDCPIVFASDPFLRLTGYRREEVLGRNWCARRRRRARARTPACLPACVACVPACLLASARCRPSEVQDCGRGGAARAPDPQPRPLCPPLPCPRPSPRATRRSRFLQGRDTDRATVLELKAAIKAGRECTVRLLNYTKAGKPFWNMVRRAGLPGLEAGAGTGAARSQGCWQEAGTARGSLGAGLLRTPAMTGGCIRRAPTSHPQLTVAPIRDIEDRPRFLVGVQVRGPLGGLRCAVCWRVWRGCGALPRGVEAFRLAACWHTVHCTLHTDTAIDKRSRPHPPHARQVDVTDHPTVAEAAPVGQQAASAVGQALQQMNWVGVDPWATFPTGLRAPKPHRRGDPAAAALAAAVERDGKLRLRHFSRVGPGRSGLLLGRGRTCRAARRPVPAAAWRRPAAAPKRGARPLAQPFASLRPYPATLRRAGAPAGQRRRAPQTHPPPCLTAAPPGPPHPASSLHHRRCASWAAATWAWWTWCSWWAPTSALRSSPWRSGRCWSATRWGGGGWGEGSSLRGRALGVL